MAVPQNHPLSHLDNAGLPPKGNKKTKHREQLPLGETRPKSEKKKKKEKKHEDGDALVKSANSKSHQYEKTPNKTTELSGQGNTAARDIESTTATQDLVKNQKTKKAKKDPLRPEPAWLFPPDEENTALNPKPKTKAQEDEEVNERQRAIDYLQHHAVGAPHKPAPPAILLQLVGAFLDSYGFNSTGRVFTAEREARRKILGWQDPNGTEKLDPKGPSLVEIYKQWLATQALKPVTKNNPMNGSIQANGLPVAAIEIEDTSSEGSSASSDNDASDDDASSDSASSSSAKKVPLSNGSSIVVDAKADNKVLTKSNEQSSSESDSNEDDSESDSDVEVEVFEKPKPIATVKAAAARPTVNSMVDSLKRKESNLDSGSDTDSTMSSSNSGASAEKAKVKKNTTKSARFKSTKQVELNAMKSKDFEPLKTTTQKTTPTADKMEAKPLKSMPAKPAPAPAAAVKKEHMADDTSSMSSSDIGAAEDQVKKVKKKSKSSKGPDLGAGKRKRSSSPHSTAEAITSKVAKKNSAPFQRIPSDTKVDPKLSSNAYQPYDYANRAYQDLSVTKGKGFTKEKNKKKRGSYRGGTIDVAGGKGVKFED